MTPLFIISGWEFDFGKGIAKAQGYPETRFKIKGNVVLKHNGRWWERGFFDPPTDKQVVEAYGHWQFERVVLR